MSLFFEFEILIALFGLFIMLYAAIEDLKHREVYDYPWLILIFSSVIINIIRIVLYFNSPVILIVGFLSISTGLLLAILMFYIGIWGEADILALISISLFFPWPLLTLFPVSESNQRFLSIFPFSLTVLINVSLLQIPIPLLLGVKNFIHYKKAPSDFQEPTDVPKYKKVLASFLGEPLPLKEVFLKSPWFYNFLESYYIPNTISWENYKIQRPWIRMSSEQLLRQKMFRKVFWKKLLPIRFPQTRFQDFFGTPKRDINFQARLLSPEEDLYNQRVILEKASTDPNTTRLWIQYNLPMLFFLFLSLIISLFFGNILFLIF